MFVVCCWGGRVVPLRAWSKSSLTLVSLLRLSSISPLIVICVNGYVVVCCWWGGMVVILCACLLLPVEGLSLQEEWGKSLTVSGSLSSDLIMHGWEGWLRLFSEGWALVLPHFLHFSHSSCLASVYLICWWGGSVCSSANLGPSNFSKSRSSPLHVVFSILFHYFLCSLPLPLFLQGWQGCLLTSGVVSVYLLGKVVPKGAWSKSSLTLCSLLCCLSLSLSLSPIDCIWVEGLALEGRSGKALSS